MKRFLKAMRFVFALLVCGAAVALTTRVLAQVNSPQLEWRANGATDSGIRSLNGGKGGDGTITFVKRGESLAVANQSGTTPPSVYLYFNVDKARLASLGKAPLYLSVEYFDAAIGGAVGLHYDSAGGDENLDIYYPADAQAGGWLSGSKQWKTTIFQLDKPRFSGRQNWSGDFRVFGDSLAVRRVVLSKTRPTNWEQVNIIPVINVKPLVKIGAGGQLIIGGFDPESPESALRQVHQLAGTMPVLKSLGVTSQETYVRWNLCEPKEGVYDWSIYDRYVDLLKKNNRKWVPFLIFGSAYSLPDWYYKKPGSQGYVCLEHGEESDVQSLWNPVLRAHLSRFIKAFCEHYRDSGVIETVQLGITGNYGEAIYPVSGNDWTASVHGDYHSHPGFWAGDPFAVADFRRAMRAKYKSDAAISAAWGKSVALDSIKPFLRKDAPNDRAWLDFVDWYIDSMTEYSRFWMQQVRANFPRGDIQICTGGHAPPEHGADFGEQCRVAAEFGGGVRITNEGSDYANNFSLTRWVASAAQQYGATYSFEPASVVNPLGVIRRIYGATSSGANGLHYYNTNLLDSKDATQNFIKWGGYFQQRKPIVEVAVYYPETDIRLHGNNFLKLVRPLRDRFDFDYMSDGQIRDGGLGRVKALILMQGATSEAATWRRITDWVKSGGVLLYADGIGKLRTVEGDESPHDALLDANAKLGSGQVRTFHGAGDSVEYRAFLASTLAQAPQLSPATRAMIAADGKDDGLYVALTAPNELLWLNVTDNEARLESPTAVVLAPQSITAQKLAAN